MSNREVVAALLLPPVFQVTPFLAFLSLLSQNCRTSCAGGRHNMPPPLQVDLCPFDLEIVYESRVTWATSVPILVLLDLSVRDN